MRLLLTNYSRPEKYSLDFSMNSLPAWLIIDRFEGDFAVLELEDYSFVNMPKKLIPTDSKEGTVLSINLY